MRKFGCLPPEEVELHKHYRTEDGMEITIEAAKSGYTIISNGGTQYEDIEDTAENNLFRGTITAQKIFGILKEMECDCHHDHE